MKRKLSLGITSVMLSVMAGCMYNRPQEQPTRHLTPREEIQEVINRSDYTEYTGVHEDGRMIHYKRVLRDDGTYTDSLSVMDPFTRKTTLYEDTFIDPAQSVRAGNLGGLDFYLERCADTTNRFETSNELFIGGIEMNKVVSELEEGEGFYLLTRQ